MESWEPGSTKTGGQHLSFLPGYLISTGLPTNCNHWVAHEFLLAPGLVSSTRCSSAELQPPGPHQECWGHQEGFSCSPLPCLTPPVHGDSHSFITLKTCHYWKICSVSSPLSSFLATRLLRITLNQGVLVHPPKQVSLCSLVRTFLFGPVAGCWRTKLLGQRGNFIQLLPCQEQQEAWIKLLV